MPNRPQSHSRDVASIAKEKQPISFWFFAASILLFLGVLLVGTTRGYGHLHPALLLIQYALMLPAVLVYLRRRQDRIPQFNNLAAIRPRLLVACFAVVALPLSWLSVRGLLNPDESGYSFQARIYRSGRVMAEPLIGASSNVRETPAELFYANHVLRPNGWFPKFPPGWPLVLSLGYLVSARWLLTPIFGLLQLVVIIACGRQCFSTETGLLASLFAALSPFYLVNSIGMMSHALCALLAATACLAFFRGLATGRLRYYGGMFACLAATLQVRPYTGFVLTAVLTAAALWLNLKSRRAFFRVLAIGAFFGAIALICVLLDNHTYTGHWLVSPYALAAGDNTPPELSFSPMRVWQGVRQYAPRTMEESLIGAFPFLFLLGGYALVTEKKHRKEIWILACLYCALVIAYLAHPDGSGVFFGERFHFEGFFAMALVSARGLQLLVDRWRTSRTTLVCALILFSIMQIAQQAATATIVARRGEPYRKVREAVESSGISGLIFLHDSPGFVAKHFNLNDADWRHAARIYLIDAEPEQRSAWTCRYGLTEWTAVSYEPVSHRAILATAKAACTGANPQ